jgi:hypothetical protein
MSGHHPQVPHQAGRVRIPAFRFMKMRKGYCELLLPSLNRTQIIQHARQGFAQFLLLHFPQLCRRLSAP